jgi:hypothetical protein
MRRLAGLIGFITIMWIMILAVAAFLIVFVAPIDVILFRGSLDRLVTSIIQAFIAITVVIILVLGLNKMKTIYMRKKLQL